MSGTAAAAAAGEMTVVVTPGQDLEQPSRGRGRPKKLPVEPMKPQADEILDLSGLAERWGVGDPDELKKIIRTLSVPYLTLRRTAAKKIHWDNVRFKLDAIRRWEDANQCVYAERRPEPASRGESRPKSMLRCKRR